MAKEIDYTYIADNTNTELVVMPKRVELTDTVRARMIAESKKSTPAPDPAPKPSPKPAGSR